MFRCDRHEKARNIECGLTALGSFGVGSVLEQFYPSSASRSSGRSQAVADEFASFMPIAKTRSGRGTPCSRECGHHDTPDRSWPAGLGKFGHRRMQRRVRKERLHVENPDPPLPYSPDPPPEEDPSAVGYDTERFYPLRISSYVYRCHAM